MVGISDVLRFPQTLMNLSEFLFYVDLGYNNYNKHIRGYFKNGL